MIDYLRGTAVHMESDYIVVDVQGVGYRVFCPNPYVFPMDEDTVVYIHYHVRDDATLLYGFASREEQALFRRLLDVSGIGPRVAMGILSGGRPEEVVMAIRQENIAFLTKLPGIGKKTAQRMILDLKDKLDSFFPGAESIAGSQVASSAAHGAGGWSTAWEEAREGLSALGYSEAELDRAWEAIKGTELDNASVDILMKQALKALYKG